MAEQQAHDILTGTVASLASETMPEAIVSGKKISFVTI
jgi:hypothetical protein